MQTLSMPTTRTNLCVALDHEHTNFTGTHACESARIATKLIAQNPNRVHGRNLGVYNDEGGAECSRIQACIAIPAATPTLMERVEPYCAIEHTMDDALHASSLKPGPS